MPYSFKHTSLLRPKNPCFALYENPPPQYLSPKGFSSTIFQYFFKLFKRHGMVNFDYLPNLVCLPVSALKRQKDANTRYPGYHGTQTVILLPTKIFLDAATGATVFAGSQLYLGSLSSTLDSQSIRKWVSGISFWNYSHSWPLKIIRCNRLTVQNPEEGGRPPPSSFFI